MGVAFSNSNFCPLKLKCFPLQIVYLENLFPSLPLSFSFQLMLIFAVCQLQKDCKVQLL